MPVHVQPKARRDAVVGVIDGRLKVAVRQPPERGKANRAVLQLLAETLGVRKNALCLVSGHTSSRKTVRVQGLSATTLEQRLQEILRSDS